MLLAGGAPLAGEVFARVHKGVGPLRLPTLWHAHGSGSASCKLSLLRHNNAHADEGICFLSKFSNPKENSIWKNEQRNPLKKTLIESDAE